MKLQSYVALVMLLLMLANGHAQVRITAPKLPCCENDLLCDQKEAKKWDFFADVLVWSLQETCTQWAFIVMPKFTSPPAAPFTGNFDAVLKAVNFDWNTGVRTGVS